MPLLSSSAGGDADWLLDNALLSVSRTYIDGAYFYLLLCCVILWYYCMLFCSSDLFSFDKENISTQATLKKISMCFD